MNFAALLKSEFRKLVYARSTWWLLGGAVAFSSLGVGVMPLILNANTAQVGGTVTTGLMNSEAIGAMFGKAAAGYYFSMILGAMLLAGEFAKGTAIATFLAAPKRSSVLWAKVVMAALVGLGVQIISGAIASGVGALVLTNFKHADPPISAFGDLALTASVSGIVLGLVGLAVGALVRNQTGAIVGLLAWMFLIDPILTVLTQVMHYEVGKYLFTALISGMMDLHLSGLTSSRMLGGLDYLSPLVSMAVLLAYAAALVAAALATSLRRDID
jgi:ABC-type transport system involved in multi-copper enzyme maturation permease subunit